MARRVLPLALAAFVLFAYGLGVGSLWDQDESRYTQIAKDILTTGDLFTLRVDGRPWFDKPPLYMWLVAATGRLFGFTEFAARVWSAISGALAVAATALIARLFYGDRVALVAGAVLATMLEFFVIARLAVLDAMLVAFMLLAFYMALVAGRTGSRAAFGWAWVWAGFATAAKTPVGLLLPAAVIAALWVVRRDASGLRAVPWWGPVVYAIIGLGWYAVETVRHGDVFVRTALGHYLISRVYTVVDNQPGPWWFYVPVVLGGAYPWTVFVVPALVYAVRRRDAGGRVVLLWIGITLLGYSAAATKLPNYVLPVFPMLAIAIARLAVDALDGATDLAGRLIRWGMRLLVVAVALIVAGVALFAAARHPRELEALHIPLLAMGAIFAGAPLLAVVLYYLGRPAQALGALMLTFVVAAPVLAHHTLPAIEGVRPVPRLGRVLRETTGDDTTVAAVRLSLAPSLRYYAGRPIIWIEDSQGLADVVCRHDRLALVVRDEDHPWVSRVLPEAAREQVREAGHRILLIEGGPCRPAPRGQGDQPAGR